MKVLVVGASGATGRLLVAQLLDRGVSVKIIVRPQRALPENLTHREKLTTIRATILDLSNAEMAQHVKGCNAVASCLGHNLSLKGIYGQPRQLVTDATRRLCKAIKSNQPETPVKFVLMNTTGNSNRDIPERVSFGEKCVLGLLRLLMPPQVDNEKAADFLRVKIGQTDSEIEWVVVRPDTLANEGVVTEYEVYPSPIRSAIFNPGITSRINVSHFMTELITNEESWIKWKGRMPVLYNRVLPLSHS